MNTNKGAIRAPAYYLGLSYPTTVRQLTAEEGGGFVAFIPSLGRDTFVATGDSREAALVHLDNLKAHLIPAMVERGEYLPEPPTEE